MGQRSQVISVSQCKCRIAIHFLMKSLNPNWMLKTGTFTRASFRAFWSCMGRLRPQHEQQSKLSCQNIVHYFTSRFSISEPHSSEECFNSFLVCLETTTGLRLRHRTPLTARQCLSVRSLPCILANV